MSTEIYYFSGTGNSLVIARDIAEKTKGRLIPIPSLNENNPVDTQADVIGIVFPVYYLELPLIIKRFASKLENIKDKYIFAVCNYGGGMGTSMKSLSTIIGSHEGRLSAKYGVHMRQNAFNKPWENDEKILKNWRKKLEKIVKNIIRRKKGFFIANILWRFLLLPFEPLFKSLISKALAKYADQARDPSMDMFINFSDKSYSVNEKCNGCRVCMQVCPVDNINIINDKPVWLNHCEACLACYNWCPVKAIQGGISQKGYYYRNPNVKVADMLKQKESMRA